MKNIPLTKERRLAHCKVRYLRANGMIKKTPGKIIQIRVNSRGRITFKCASYKNQIFKILTKVNGLRKCRLLPILFSLRSLNKMLLIVMMLKNNLTVLITCKPQRTHSIFTIEPGKTWIINIRVFKVTVEAKLICKARVVVTTVNSMSSMKIRYGTVTSVVVRKV